MAFASIYVPIFTVQAVMRGEPALRGCPIALVDGTPPVWNVVAVNEAAARAGIEPGMAKSQATQFSGVQIRPRSRMQEGNAHAALLDLGWSISPRVEDAAADSLVLDLAGLESLFGSKEKIANQIVQSAHALGLAVNVAVASCGCCVPRGTWLSRRNTGPPWQRSGSVREFADLRTFAATRNFRNSQSLGRAHLCGARRIARPRAFRKVRAETESG